MEGPSGQRHSPWATGKLRGKKQPRQPRTQGQWSLSTLTLLVDAPRRKAEVLLRVPHTTPHTGGMK